jgi:hypothetical protein
MNLWDKENIIRKIRGNEVDEKNLKINYKFIGKRKYPN